MRIFIIALALLVSSSQVFAAEITADGWNDYGSILRLLTYKKGAFDEKILSDIAEKMTYYSGNDEFKREEVRSLKPGIKATLKKLALSKPYPGDQVTYTMTNFRDNHVEYHFGTKRLCFDEPTSMNGNGPEGPWSSKDYAWKNEIDREFDYSGKRGKTDWSIGFEGNIYNQAGDKYCIKVEDLKKAKELKGLWAFGKEKPIAIIDAKITDTKVSYRFSIPRINGLTTVTKVKLLDRVTREVIYETSDVMVEQ